jgi:hypothetical protein
VRPISYRCKKKGKKGKKIKVRGGGGEEDEGVMTRRMGFEGRRREAKLKRGTSCGKGTRRRTEETRKMDRRLVEADDDVVVAFLFEKLTCPRRRPARLSKSNLQ